MAAGADDHGHVEDVGTGQRLAEPQELRELPVREPAAVVHQQAPGVGQHAPKAGEADLEEAEEELRVRRPHSVLRILRKGRGRVQNATFSWRSWAMRATGVV